MTPPDQPDEQPSALSRLERALAGFGNSEPEAESPAPDAPEAAETATDAASPIRDVATDDDDDDDDDDESVPDRVEASPVLDIASALDAVERLSAAQEAEPEPAAAGDAIAALERQWATQDRNEEPELPRLEPADLQARIPEFAQDRDTAVDEPTEEPPPDAAAADEPAAAVPGRDAASSWERNVGDQNLPYFLVEDNHPVGVVAPETVMTPTIEELRVANPELAKEHQQATVLRTLLEIPILLVVAAVIAFLVKTFLAQAYYIPSGSMLPQLQIDDRVVVSKLAYKAHDPRRGDIIVFDDPRNGAAAEKDDEGLLRKVGEGIGVVQPSTDEFIKRVIGLPGETVEGRDGHVFVNGHRLYEPYLQNAVVTSDFPKTKVKTGHLWVMGDNRAGSADSRVFGQIEIDTIVGRAMVTVWPFGNAKFL